MGPYWHHLEGTADVLNSRMWGQEPGVLKLGLQEEGMVQKLGYSLWVSLVSGPQSMGTGTGLCLEKGDRGCSLSTWDSIVQSTQAESPALTHSPVLTSQPSCPIRLHHC